MFKVVRFLHSMPISHSAPLWGHVLTLLVSNIISIVAVILVAFVVGFRPSAGLRSLLENQPVGNDICVALVWCVGILIIAYLIAVRVYKKRV